MLQRDTLVLPEVTLSLPSVTLQPMREDWKHLTARLHALNRERKLLRFGELAERTVMMPNVV
ncbi:MAG: DUF4419 domain-containing protein [Puniceicoccales bacterium]|nr:DUF4419 domain-containing protein [Puniceicoccales bacterium]